MAEASVISPVKASSAPRLSNATLFFYSLTNLPISMATIVVGVYVTKFYASEMGVPLALLGTINLSIRIVDAFADPLMGYISDHTRSRFGRRRPASGRSLAARRAIRRAQAPLVPAPPDLRGTRSRACRRPA